MPKKSRTFPARAVCVGNLNVIIKNLRDEIQKAPAYEDYLIILMNRCCEDIEAKNYILPVSSHFCAADQRHHRACVFVQEEKHVSNVR